MTPDTPPLAIDWQGAAVGSQSRLRINQKQNMKAMTRKQRIAHLSSLFKGHMRPEISNFARHWRVVARNGTTYYYPFGETPIIQDGESLTLTDSPYYLFRWSAPGYLDCTDWTPCEELSDIIAILEDEIYEQGDCDTVRKANL